MDHNNRTINNRKQTHITRIEFARIQEGYVIVRITCKTARPEKVSVSTHVVSGAATYETPDSRAIQNAIGELRAEYAGTKIVLDPDADLEPISPLSKWTYAWQKPLARASLGLNWDNDFPITSSELEATTFLDSEDTDWVKTHARVVADSSQNGTPRPSRTTQTDTRQDSV